MDLIILASGNSSRFKKDGYEKSKYMLPFLGKSIISYLIKMKGIKNIICVHNKSDFCDKDIQLDYLYSTFDVPIKLLCIEDHKNGPGFSLKKIQQFINDNNCIAVTYCDYISSSFGKELSMPIDTDCSVLTYSGFHPHHIFPENIYGYLKLNDDGLVIDYLEKKSFTDNKLKEECSAGLYLFKSGRILKESIKSVYNNVDKYIVNNEIYVSMLIKNLIDNGKKVDYFQTNFFAQLGTPLDYEDHITWVKNALELKNKNHAFNHQIVKGIYLMLVSGYGKRFKEEGIYENKSLLKINNISTLENAMIKLPRFTKYVFSIQENDKTLVEEIKKICLKLEIKPLFIKVKMPNEGQAASAKQVIDELYKSNFHRNLPIFIAPCDSVISLPNEEFINIMGKASGCVVSKTNPLSRLNPSSYSYAIIDSINSQELKKISYISVKEMPKESNDKISFITGAFFYKSLDHLYKDINTVYDNLSLSNKEKYLDEFYSYLIRKNKREIFGLFAESYCSLGTPIEYKIGNYWNSFVNDINKF